MYDFTAKLKKNLSNNVSVEEIFFISMDGVSGLADGVSGLADGAKSIFPNVIVQRCIVHLIRNSIKYIPSKDYKAFTANLKKIYRAPSLKAAENEFEKFKQTCLFCHTAFCHPDFNQMHNNTCRLKSVSDFTCPIIL